MYSDDDELEYEDIEDEYYEEDDEDYIDADDDGGAGRLGGSSRPSGSSPFSRSSSGSPFSRSSGSGNSGSPFSRSSSGDSSGGAPRPPTFSSTGGGGFGSSGSGSSGGGTFNRSSGSNPFARSGGDDDKDSAPPSRTSSGSSTFSRSGGGSGGGSPFSRSGGDDDKSSPPSRTSSGSSTFSRSGGGSSGGSPFSRSGGDDNKGSSQPSRTSSGGSRTGSFDRSGSGSQPNRTSSGGSSSGSGSSFNRSGSGSQPNRTSSGGSSSGTFNRSGGGGSSFGNRSGSSSGDDKGGASSGSSGRSSFSGGAGAGRGLPGGGSRPSAFGKPDDKKDAPKPTDDKKDAKASDDKKDDSKADGDADKGASRLSGLRRSFGGAAGAATGFMANLRGGAKKDDDAAGDDKPDDKKSDNKPTDDKKGAPTTSGGTSSPTSRSPFQQRAGGGSSTAPSPAPTTQSAGGSSSTAPASGSGGGRFSNFGRGTTKPAATDDKKDAPKPAESPKRGARFGGAGGNAFGKTSAPAADAKGDAKPADDKKDDKPAAASGGFGARIAAATATLPFIGKGEDKPKSKTAREQTKAPKVKAGLGLSLDRKLDILGVGLVLVSLALMLSRLSPTQGIATEYVNNLLGQLLGWGALAVPLSMFAVGMWLIIRHFGDDAPTLDMERIIGIVVMYIGLLVLFQFIRSMSYQNISSYADLEFQTRLSWEAYRNGGGWLGGNLYLLLVQYLGEILAFSVTLFVIVVGIMFTLDLSVSEIAIIMVGLYRSYTAAQRRSNERKRVRRAERIAHRQEQVAALAPPPLPGLDVSKPQAQALGSGESRGALPAPDPARAIPITMGGKTVTTSMNGEQQPVEVASAQAAPQQKSGLLGRTLGAVGLGGAAIAATTASQSNDKPAEKSSSSPLGGLMNRLPFGGKSKADDKPVATSGIQATGMAANETNIPTTVQQASAPTAPPTHLPTPPTTATPPTTTPPTADKPNPFAGAPTAPPSMPPTATSPTGRPNPFAGTPPSTADTPPRKASPFDSVLGKPAESNGAPSTTPTEKPNPFAGSPFGDTPAPPPATPPTDNSAPSTTPASRVDRLNAIRQGQAGHPSAATPPPAKPEDAVPPTNGNGQAPTPPVGNHMVAGKTDAYGNAPKPPTSTARPDQLKPEPPAVTQPKAPRRLWQMPDINDLLNEGSEQDFDRQFLVDQARVIEETLRSFGAPGRVVEINTGPVITQYGVEPDYLLSKSGKRSRVKVGAIAQLDRDLQLALGARSIRIEAPVPGKGYVGIEIPNAENALVSLKDVMESDNFVGKRKKSPLTIALGQSVDGTPIAADLTSMPHLLIAGTTGSGKSVCVNSIICSLLANNSPEDLRFIMVDPKRVELTGYNSVPHLAAPVVVELERIVGVLKWVTREMDERYKRFSTAGARNIVDFNKHLQSQDEKMPYIVVIIDELADLMMLAPEETERTITRIAALARATGIHLVIATQRPSVDVVTGLIKANFPARIAFAVAGGVDSRVILDQPGAERLLGRGDMLYLSGDSPAPQRLQGVFVSDEEIENITRYWKTQSGGRALTPVKGMAPLSLDPSSAPRQMTPSGVSGVAPNALNMPASLSSSPAQVSFWDDGNINDDNNDEPDDELYQEAVELVRRLNKASVSLLQRRLRIGYTRASRLIDMMEENGVIGPQESGSKPRTVLPT